MKKEIKVVVIGYPESEDGLHPCSASFILESDRDIPFFEVAHEIAVEYGYYEEPIIVSDKDLLFKKLNLESQFNEKTRRFNADDYIDYYVDYEESSANF